MPQSRPCPAWLLFTGLSAALSSTSRPEDALCNRSKPSPTLRLVSPAGAAGRRRRRPARRVVLWRHAAAAECGGRAAGRPTGRVPGRADHRHGPRVQVGVRHIRMCSCMYSKFVRLYDRYVHVWHCGCGWRRGLYKCPSTEHGARDPGVQLYDQCNVHPFEGRQGLWWICHSGFWCPTKAGTLP